MSKHSTPDLPSGSISIFNILVRPGIKRERQTGPVGQWVIEWDVLAGRLATVAARFSPNRRSTKDIADSWTRTPCGEIAPA